MSKRKNNWIIELVLIIILLVLPLLVSQITGFAEFSIYLEDSFGASPIEEITNETYSIPIIEEPIQEVSESSDSDFGIQPLENLSVQLEDKSGFGIMPIENLSIQESIRTNGSNNESGFLIQQTGPTLVLRNITGGFSTSVFGSDSPTSITTNISTGTPTDFWITDDNDDFVYHVNITGSNMTDGFKISTAGSGSPYGITTNGSDFWITDVADDFVYHFNRGGSNMTNGFKISTAGSGSSAGITTNGSDFWISDSDDDFVYHFNRAGSNMTDGFKISTAGSNNPSDISTNNTDFWITDDNDDFVYHFNRAGSNMTDGFSISTAGSGSSTGITANGSDFWISDNTDDFVYHFLFMNNSAPTANIPGITPYPAYTNDTLNCSTYIYDLELDMFNINFTWYNGTNLAYSNKISARPAQNITDGFSTSAFGATSPSGIETNGSDFWMIDCYTDDFVYHTDSFGNNMSDGFSTSAFGSDTPSGIETNGSDFWITDTNDGFVYHTDSFGNNMSDGFSTSAFGCQIPRDITANGSDFWIADDTDDFVYHFNRVGSNMTDGFSTSTAGSGSSSGITTNGSDFWITDNNDGFVYHLLPYNDYNYFPFSNGSLVSGILTPGLQNKGETWNCTVTANDYYDTGSPQSNTTTIDNTIPTIPPPIYIYSDNNKKNNTLVNLTGTFSVTDSEGDPMVLNETRWYNNSIEETGLRNLTLVLADNTTRFENWMFSARTYDGTDWSSWTNSSNFTILNDLPNITFAYIISDDDTKNNTLVNLTGTFSVTDSEGDPMVLNETRWYNNSIEETGLRNLTLVLADNTTRFEKWMFSARTYDGYDWSIWTNSSNFTILNEPSNITSIYITSEDNTKNNTLVNLTGTFSVTDSEGDPMVLNETRWYNNFIEETGLRNFTLVLAGNTTVLDKWMFSARTYDGYDWSIWTNSSNFTILRSCLCSSCYECIIELNSSTCSTVNLTQSVTDYTTTCINNPTNFSNKIFDCQGYTLDGTDADHKYGIYFTGAARSNNTIQNCIFTDFYDGIRSTGGSGYHYIINNTFTSNGYGIYLTPSSNNIIVNNTFDSGLAGVTSDSSRNNTINNNIMISNSGQGIYLYETNNSIITNNNISLTSGGMGILLNSKVINTNITNNRLSGNKWGIYIASNSDNNLFINNTIQNSPVWDWFGTATSLNNTVINLTTHQNIISFTSKDIALRGLQPSEAPPDPTGYSNVNEWINVTNNSADSWVYLNFSYPESNVDESTLEIWRYNGTNWNKSGFYKTNILDISKNVIGANITNFSIFAPFGTALIGPTGGPSHVYPRKIIPENITNKTEKTEEIKKEVKLQEPTTFVKEDKFKEYRKYIPLTLFSVILLLVLFRNLVKHKINKNKKYSKNHANRSMYRKKKKY